MWKKFWCKFVMTHFMSLSKLEKNLSKWNANCRNNWDIPNDQKSRRQKEIDRTFDKVESILDSAWKDHIKNHIKWGWEIPCQFYIEENEYDITLKDINVFDDLGRTIAFKNKKYQVCFASSGEDIDSYKRLRVSVTI
jgi:hypothetical protein